MQYTCISIYVEILHCNSAEYKMGTTYVYIYVFAIAVQSILSTLLHIIKLGFEENSDYSQGSKSF